MYFEIQPKNANLRHICFLFYLWNSFNSVADVVENDMECFMEDSVIMLNTGFVLKD